MTDFFEQLKKDTSNLRLRERRKQEIRANLLAFIEADEAVRGGAPARHTMQRSFVIRLFKEMPVIAIITIIALLGGGTSFAAERALPGNILYPVKVYVNEEIRSAFTFSSEGKAKWEAERAERRIDEAAALAAEGHLTSSTAASLAAAFEVQSGKMKQDVEKLKAKNNIQAAANITSDFEASLVAHGKILSSLKVKEPDEEDEIAPLEDSLDASLEATSEARADLEGEITSSDHPLPEIQAAAEAKIASAVKGIASVRAFLKEKEFSLGASSTAQAEAQLQIAESILADAQAKFNAKEYGDAFELASRSMRVAESARLLVRTEANLKLPLIEIDEHDEFQTENDVEFRSASSSGNHEEATSSDEHSEENLKGGSDGDHGIRIKGSGDGELKVDL